MKNYRAMIPNHPIKLTKSQPGDFKRANVDDVVNPLNTLNISLDSEIAEFFLNHTITFFSGGSSSIELLDIAGPSNYIEERTNFVHEAWEIPENLH